MSAGRTATIAPHCPSHTRAHRFFLDGPGFDPFSRGLPDTQLHPRERLELLCDVGSVDVIRTNVASHRLGVKPCAGDGVVAATGMIGGRPVVCYAQDRTVAGGSLGVAHADTILRALELGRGAGTPVIGFVESAGARMQEGSAALAGYARIFRATVELSGRVPQVSIITGTAAGGASYSPALTDFVIMTQSASMFLTGPAIVRATCGEDIDGTALGGARVHERNGVCSLAVPTDVDAAFLARELLGYLPTNSSEAPPQVAQKPPAPHDPSAPVPSTPRRVYDVRDVIAAIVDDGKLLELSPRWARNVVTALCRLAGRPVGVIANQPRWLGGVLDVDAAPKAARFVRVCNSFGLPLIVLVDTPGFMPGTRQESRGAIRHGAKLLHAFAEASVPRITLIVRKAYGGAYISMNAKDLGADLTFAWPTAEIGIMDPRSAVSILHRRELEAEPDPKAARTRLAEAYTHEHLGAHVAAAEGLVDEVIEPMDTRPRLIAALKLLRGRTGPQRPAGNIPL